MRVSSTRMTFVYCIQYLAVVPGLDPGTHEEPVLDREGIAVSNYTGSLTGITAEHFMATVTIRNFDEKVGRALKAQAKANGHSLQAELHRLLTEAAARRNKRQAFIKEAERIRRMTPKDRPQSDSVELLREDRSR